MLAFQSISLRYGEKVLFDEVSARINAHDRIGLVGANGAGKTTLFRIINRETEPDAGVIERAGFLSVGYLPQETLVVRGRTVFDEAASAFEDIHILRARLEQADAQLRSLAPEDRAYAELLETITDFEHRLEQLEADKMKAKTEKVLLGLGFSMEDLSRDCGEFSGGWQMRIALARLLLGNPSVLLLDEPTNHLDLDSLRWLEKYLRAYEGAMVIISHDRAFLDSLCTRIFALNHHRIDTYTGNYTAYLEQSAARTEQLIHAQASQQRQIAQVERFIERFRYKATKASQVQSRIKALDKIERIEVEKSEATVGKFEFPPPLRCANRVLKMEGLVKSYGEHTVLSGVNLEIERGERIAVVGPNGAGKTTLTKVIAGVEPYQGGTMALGERVAISYFAQHQVAELDPNQTALEVVCEGASAQMLPRARGILGGFLFRGDDVFKPVRVLSGGEKNRLALARILMRPTNFLVLDEPTNHLDMTSKQLLKQALLDWAGTILIVSHDRDFLDSLVTRVVEVRPHQIRNFAGNISFYIEKTDTEALQTEAGAAPKSTPSSSNKSKDRRRARAEVINEISPLKKEATRLEAIIEQKETFIRETESKMVDPAFFKSAEAPQLLKKVEELRREIEIDMSNWEELQKQIEAKQAQLEDA